MSIFSFLGTSNTHYNNASDYFSKATESAGNIVSSLRSSVSNVEPQTVKNTTVTSWHSYEYIAGKIISTNAAINFAKYLSANSEISMAAKATQCAASALVTSPVSCMAGLMATTILVANYEHIIPVLKGTANLTWEAAKTAFYASAAVAETTLGSALYVDECVSDALSYTGKFIYDALNPMSEVTTDLAGESAEIGILTS
jgi:hypothetical protein